MIVLGCHTRVLTEGGGIPGATERRADCRHALWRQLSWSHFWELLPLAEPQQREFYAEMCRIKGWSVRTLHERIESMLYERTALSKQPDELVKQELAVLPSRGDVTLAMLLKDPYILDFLGLSVRFLERDLEDAIRKYVLYARIGDGPKIAEATL